MNDASVQVTVHIAITQVTAPYAGYFRVHLVVAWALSRRLVVASDIRDELRIEALMVVTVHH